MASQPCPECGTLLSPGSAGVEVICPGCGRSVPLTPPQPARKKHVRTKPVVGGPTLHFACGQCGQPMQAASEQAGLAGRCSSCGAEVTVPELPPGALPDATTVPTPARGKTRPAAIAYGAGTALAAFFVSWGLLGGLGLPVAGALAGLAIGGVSGVLVFRRIQAGP